MASAQWLGHLPCGEVSSEGIFQEGDLAGARKLFEQALTSDLETFGNDHPDVATDRNNLGLVLHAQGELAG